MTVVQSYLKIAQVLQSDAKKANIEIDIKSVDDIEGYLKDRSACGCNDV